jgi:hypothetical protein
MGERGKHVGSSLPLRWIALAAAPSPFRRVEALHADPLAPQRRHRNAEKTLLRRCFDYIALSIGDQVNLPRPQHERKSVVQLLIPLATPDRLHPAFFLAPSISQRARSPAHRRRRADKVLGSVTSVRTSGRSGQNGFLQNRVIAVGEGPRAV